MDSDSDSQDDGLWNFRLARKFNRAFGSSSESSTAAPPLGVPDPSLYNPKVNVPKNLGDFDRLFLFCGKPIGLPPPEVRRLSTGSSSSTTSHPFSQSTPPTSGIDDNGLQDETVSDLKVKGVRWHDQIPVRAALKEERAYIKAKTDESDTAFGVSFLLVDSDISDQETDTENDEAGSDFNPSKPSTSQRQAIFSPHRPILIPASVRLFDPIPPPIPNVFLDPSIVQPALTLTAKEQKLRLIRKLAEQFSAETRISKALSRLGTTYPKGIHVFVDLSNIIIGFFNRLKFNRNIPLVARIKQPPFAFHSLAIILERGRKVARRVVVGSTISSLYNQTFKKPIHIDDAEKCNYEMNILERVSKPQQLTPMKKKHGTGSGYVTSGYSSASESASIRLAMQEQAVDEILQMKILETLVDTESPSTIVLASGDAAEAEYSGGFLTNVERALRKGWQVEVVAWSQGLSYEYRRKEFLKRWESKFKVINLDDYAEEMFAVYTQKYKYSPGVGQ
ncbi:hypothetical protein ONS95_014054 [Cadophora gregata]|uniref:uncharacterized protein n=1 Tax=Cadophora gregata TaxID=51156 RepID=UPI0026DC9C1E|nr:uncharacterized protein ONS95_014054 [Cadophora gregata]KAK0113805.1 hypothetical protein ONS96_014659 [Cadophora gregata f. sp. sojae]KAK0114566.1 hypothetical protein ONS95_014054 [Cadophora gregata]